MDKRHRNMWTIINSPDQIIEAIKTAPKWSADARNFAAVK